MGNLLQVLKDKKGSKTSHDFFIDFESTSFSLLAAFAQAFARNSKKRVRTCAHAVFLCRARVASISVCLFAARARARPLPSCPPSHLRISSQTPHVGMWKWGRDKRALVQTHPNAAGADSTSMYKTCVLSVVPTLNCRVVSCLLLCRASLCVSREQRRSREATRSRLCSPRCRKCCQSPRLCWQISRGMAAQATRSERCVGGHAHALAPASLLAFPPGAPTHLAITIVGAPRARARALSRFLPAMPVLADSVVTNHAARSPLSPRTRIL